MTLPDFLQRLEGVGKIGTGYAALCPAHEDHSPSLGVAEGDDGRILLKCRTGCSTEAICAKLGLELSDLFAVPLPKVAKPLYEFECAYDYRDERGDLLFQVVRQRLANAAEFPGHKRKKFVQRKPVASGWDYHLNGTRRVLYRLPETLAANAGATVFVTEGEKDADRLAKFGLIATTSPQGAGNWRDEYSASLKDREVVILADNDASGRDHAQAVARSLYGVAASIKVLDLPGLPEKGDVSDWLDAGGSVELLCSMVDDLQEWAPTDSPKVSKPSRLASTWGELEQEESKEGERIAFGVERGEVALLLSLPNAGKTTLSLNAAINLCLGRSFGSITEAGKARRVLYIDGETRRPRLKRDISRMAFDFSLGDQDQLREQLTLICEAEIEGESLSLTKTSHFLRLAAEAVEVKPDLIVIDTMASLCPVFSENDNAEQQRKVWRPLQKLAREADAAILVIHHVGKRTEDGQTPERVYRGRGASASGAFARSVWILTPDSVAPGLVTLSCAKIKGETPPDLRFQLDQSTRWFKPVEPVTTPPSWLDQIIAAVTARTTTAEVVNKLKGDLSERSVSDYLAEAVELGKIRKVKKGVYEPLTAPTAEPAKGLTADLAESA